MQEPPNPYSQINDTETYAERQARVSAQTQKDEEAVARGKAERQAQARADFDALGNEMAKATTRAELVELGRKRADLALYTGGSYTYENVCWSCHSDISSAIHARCSVCRWYICSLCGSCNCNRIYHPFLDMPDEIS